MPTTEHNTLIDETIDTEALTLDLALYHLTEADELALLIDDDNDAHHDRYSNDWEG